MQWISKLTLCSVLMRWPTSSGHYLYEIYIGAGCEHRTTTYSNLWKLACARHEKCKTHDSYDSPHCFEIYGNQQDDATARSHIEDVLYFCANGSVVETFFPAGSMCSGTPKGTVQAARMFSQELSQVSELQVSNLLKGQCVQAAGGNYVKFNQSWTEDTYPKCGETAETKPKATTSSIASSFAPFSLPAVVAIGLHI
eukprot:TRINITY_DN27094_c0_g1_i1.p1 TRINITY_DN27094_c0_g1~~TRINITY_DN27094_c0_g1_i1.p1  ORF type:complete len:197 (-),score=20.52 TRINITY_DN27094_c0_g1_i1:23-613(-)